MSYSVRDIKKSMPNEKVAIDKLDVWVYYFVRPISNYFTWLSIKLKLTANNASWLSIIISFLGMIVLINSQHILLGLCIMNFWIIFDCVDGNIARVTNTTSKYGVLLDAMSGYIFISVLYPSLGVVTNNLTANNLLFDGEYIFIGAMISLVSLVPRLIQNKSVSLYGSTENDISNKENYTLFHKIGLNIAGPAGLMNPLMIVAYLLGYLNIYMIFYLLVHTLIAIYTIRNTLIKSKGYEERL